MNRRAQTLSTLSLLVLVSLPICAADWYAAPNGSASGSGSISSPFDLATALSGNSPARGGDTIWLRGGTYVGAYTSYLNGTTTAMITVRPYATERVIIDGNN